MRTFGKYFVIGGISAAGVYLIYKCWNRKNSRKRYIHFCMAGCYPRECDHHCAKVCRQYVCTCDYHSGYTRDPDEQRICCKWELMCKPRSDPYAYSDQDAQVDTLTRYFGIERSLRDPHDPVRFTGVNHIPRWLHADLSSLEMDYSNILKEREVMAASRYFGPGSYYVYRSIRPYNKTLDRAAGSPDQLKLNKRDEEEARRGLLRGKISTQALKNGEMPYLD